MVKSLFIFFGGGVLVKCLIPLDAPMLKHERVQVTADASWWRLSGYDGDVEDAGEGALWPGRPGLWDDQGTIHHVYSPGTEHTECPLTHTTDHRCSLWKLQEKPFPPAISLQGLTWRNLNITLDAKFLKKLLPFRALMQELKSDFGIGSNKLVTSYWNNL